MDYVHRNDLIDAATLRELTRRSDWRAGVQLASHAGAIAATATLLHASAGSPWCVPVFALHGMLINWLYAAQHEMMHGTAFRTRAVNEWISRLTGLLLLFPRDLDRIAHFRHHRHTADPERDPELADVRPGAAPPGVAGVAWRLLGLGYWRRRLRYLRRLAAGDTRDVSFMSAPEQRTVVLEARVHVAVYALIAVAALALQTWAPVIYWLGPMIAARGAHEMQNMVEHTARPMVPDVFENTRVIRTNAFMRWLGWNMQYHCHHHLFAAIPFYRLPALDRAIGGRLPRPVSYLQGLAEIARGGAAR